MTRTQMACHCLIASAFVLVGLLVVNAAPRLASEAEASLVIARDNFTLLTAKTRSDEEALFLLDNTTQRLLIYRLNLRRNQVELVGGGDLRQIFRGAGTGGNSDDRSRGRNR